MASVRLRKDVKAEVKIRSSDRTQEVTILSTACYPHDVSIIPWCYLVAQDKSPPSDQSTPYFQLYKLSHSREQTITSLCLQYRGRINMKVLLVITAMDQQQLDTIMTSGPTLKDLTFSIVIIPKTYNEKVNSLFTGANYVEATVASLIIGKRSGVEEALFPKKSFSSEILIKATQHILQQRICVSFAYGIAGISSNERLITSFLQIIYLQTEETMDLISYDWIKKVLELLSQDVHFDAMFATDFIFYFNLAYASYAKFRSSIIHTVPGHAKVFMEHCISMLLKTPLDSITRSLQRFIESVFDRGDILGTIGIFEHTAESVISLSQTCFQIVENVHVIFLLVSIGIRFYHCCDMLKKTNNLWQTILTKYNKSTGFNIKDGLSNGLHSMSVILKDLPQTMISWKELLSLFGNEVYSFLFLKRFINLAIICLIRDNDDTSFCTDFLQPLTEKYFHASVNKKTRDNFMCDSRTFVQDGTVFISFLVSLIENHHWCMDNYIAMLEKWVAILMNLVDLSDYDNTTQLIEWIDKGQELISFSNYQTVFDTQLELKLTHQLESLPVQSFIEIIKNSSFDKPELVMEYLDKYCVSMAIATEPLSSFIVLASNILSNSDYAIELISYFKNVMAHYSRNGQSLLFILDLMSLNLHFDGLFDPNFIELIVRSVESSDVQKQLNELLSTLFRYVPLTENSFNLLILNKIIEVSFPNWTNLDTVIEAVSTVFNDSELIPEHFPTVRFVCALQLFLRIEKDTSYEYDSFTSSNKQLVIAFSVLIQNVWKVFTNSCKDEDRSPTIESFHEATKHISGFPEFVRIVSERFKPFVNSITDLVKKKNLTYHKLENLIANYIVYDAVFSCVSNIYEEVSYVTLQVLKELINFYDELVKKIQNSLVRLQHTGLQCHVKSVLSMYDIEFPEDLDRELNQVVKIKSSQVCGESDSSVESFVVLYRYHPQRDVTVALLESFSEHLLRFMKPLSSIDVLALNCLCPSVVFSKCIEYYQQLQMGSSTNATGMFDGCELKMRQLNNAVEQARSRVEDLIEETLSMATALEIFSTVDLQSLSVKNENKALQKFYQLKNKRAIHIDVSDILTPFLELYDVHKHIFSLQMVCASFNLTKCLADPVLNELTNIANQVIKQDMTAKEARGKVEHIKQIFKIDDSLVDHPCFRLFSCVKDSCELYTFAKERKYTGTNGIEKFIQEHGLATELSHDDHDQQLLSVLMSAMQFLLCFFGETSSITEIWDEINKRDLENVTEHLKIVGENIAIIEAVFNRINSSVLIHELKILTQRNKQLVTVNDEMKNQVDKLEQKIETLHTQLDSEKDAHANLRNQITDVQKQVDELVKVNLEKSNQIDKLQQDMEIVCMQLDAERKASADARNEVSELQKELHHWVVERNEIEMTEILLGEGGWGDVKVAKFRGLEVAAKCLYRTILSDFNLALFNREMEISSRLHHPNLIQFLGATQEGIPIILTELMTTTLRSELEKTSLTRPQIIKIAQEVSLALNYLHLYKPKPILHRDVSSSNVLLDPAGTGIWKAKLSDFGSANFLHKISRNSAAGAPLYLAPEAPYPDLHSTAMDVYSFGAVLMEMVLKQPPCETTHEREDQSKSIKWKSMKAIVQKCLSHDYKKRPSILQVHNDLDKL